MNLGTLTERNARIVRRYQDGETMEAIGGDYGITRERVRQILERAGVPRRQPKDWLSGRRVEYVTYACLACGQEHECAPSRRIPKETFCDRECRTLYRRDQLIEDMQRLARRLGRTPGQPQINAHAPPYHMDYYRYFGSVRAAQQAAGLTPNKIGRPYRNGHP